MKIYFRYTLFRSPQSYFRCTAGALHGHAPKFSCSVKKEIIKSCAMNRNIPFLSFKSSQ